MILFAYQLLTDPLALLKHFKIQCFCSITFLQHLVIFDLTSECLDLLHLCKYIFGTRSLVRITNEQCTLFSLKVFST